MWPVLFYVRGMPITVLGLAIPWIVFGWLFGLWRQIRQEHEPDQVLEVLLSVMTAALFTGIIGYSMAYGKTGIDPVLTACGGLIMLVFRTAKKNWDFWEWMDKLARKSVWIVLIGFAAAGPSWRWWIAGSTIGILITFWAQKSYRRLRWYKSGRIGFVGLVTLLWLCIVQMVVAIRTPGTIYWGGLAPQQWFAIWVGAVCISLLHLRSTLKEIKLFSRRPRLWRKINLRRKPLANQ